jgi:hypothetical protein
MQLKWCLPSKHKALSSNPSIAGKKKKDKTKTLGVREDPISVLLGGRG